VALMMMERRSLPGTRDHRVESLAITMSSRAESQQISPLQVVDKSTLLPIFLFICFHGFHLSVYMYVLYSPVGGEMSCLPVCLRFSLALCFDVAHNPLSAQTKQSSFLFSDRYHDEPGRYAYGSHRPRGGGGFFSPGLVLFLGLPAFDVVVFAAGSSCCYRRHNQRRQPSVLCHRLWFRF